MADLFETSTRLKMTYVLLALIFIEAIIRAFFKEFPFMEASGVEVVIGGWYMQKKSDDNIQRINADNVEMDKKS